MENFLVNKNPSGLEVFNLERGKIEKEFKKFSEEYLPLYKLLVKFLDCGFITTSCSKGHNETKWKDAFYVAMYVDNKNVCKVLNLINNYLRLLTNNERQLVNFTFNYRVNVENITSIEYMFGIQIDVFEDCELKEILIQKLITALCNDLNKKEIPLDYNFIYVINRFINYRNEKTSWINISVNANNYSEKFEFIFKKYETDKGVIRKEYSYNLGFDEFEYLMNY